MSDKILSTESYKGVRDFYPEDMAVQRYIFDTWAKTAESFGFERYDASILEPADLYKAKGAENEEMVNEQTYTFIDRGEREVTLRPEMTPTVARLVAGKRRELSFPVRWYSIPNLFRYERPQRGRLREHWQLNCDIFGADHYTADVEIIALAHQLLLDFGARPEMFEIRINHRGALNAFLANQGITDKTQVRAVTNVIDRKAKVSAEEFASQLETAAGKPLKLPETMPDEVEQVIAGLTNLGVTNTKYDPSIVRGFSYYTGTIFEIFDVSGENNRSMLGGGRYDNLTGMFGGEPISGIGFGMGDVTMRDFLETHHLLPETLTVTGPEVMVIPTDPERNLDAQALAATLRRATTARVATDIGTKKLGKKIGDASDRGVRYVVVVGEQEIETQAYTIKDLQSGEETQGALAIIEGVINGR
jgi:histidyl-tRNA synthetase